MPDGNTVQIRAVAEQVGSAAAEEAVRRYIAMNPPKAEVPPPLKWAGAIVAGLFGVAVSGVAIWVVGSISTIQVTLARMDERMTVAAPVQENRFANVEARISKLEAANAGRPAAPN